MKYLLSAAVLIMAKSACAFDTGSLLEEPLQEPSGIIRNPYNNANVGRVEHGRIANPYNNSTVGFIRGNRIVDPYNGSTKGLISGNNIIDPHNGRVLGRLR